MRVRCVFDAPRPVPFAHSVVSPIPLPQPPYHPQGGLIGNYNDDDNDNNDDHDDNDDNDAGDANDGDDDDDDDDDGDDNDHADADSDVDYGYS